LVVRPHSKNVGPGKPYGTLSGGNFFFKRGFPTNGLLSTPLKRGSSVKKFPSQNIAANIAPHACVLSMIPTGDGSPSYHA